MRRGARKELASRHQLEEKGRNRSLLSTVGMKKSFVVEARKITVSYRH
jgi:hypothetical protein